MKPIGFRAITIFGLLYWTVFWLMNGADKFLSVAKLLDLFGLAKTDMSNLAATASGWV